MIARKKTKTKTEHHVLVLVWEWHTDGTLNTVPQVVAYLRFFTCGLKDDTFPSRQTNSRPNNLFGVTRNETSSFHSPNNRFFSFKWNAMGSINVKTFPWQICICMCRTNWVSKINLKSTSRHYFVSRFIRQSTGMKKVVYSFQLHGKQKHCSSSHGGETMQTYKDFKWGKNDGEGKTKVLTSKRKLVINSFYSRWFPSLIRYIDLMNL